MLVDFSRRHDHKVWQITGMIELNMKLYGAFGRPEFGPVIQRQAKINGRGIQTIKRILEAKLMRGRNHLAFGQHHKKEFFKQLMASMPVGITKGGAVDWSYPQVIQPLGLRGKSCFNAAERILSCQLSKKHRDKVVPRTESSCMVLGFGLFYDLFKFVSRKYLQHLSQYRMMVVHRFKPPVLIGLWLSATNIIRSA